MSEPAADSAGLSVEGLTVQYDATEALAGIDLTVAEHEVVCLIGASGSGGGVFGPVGGNPSWRELPFCFIPQEDATPVYTRHSQTGFPGNAEDAVHVRRCS